MWSKKTQLENFKAFKIKTQAQVDDKGEGARKESKGYCSPRNVWQCF
jgi:hypothetical protein